MNEILAIIYLTLITVATIVISIHNIYTNKEFLKQSTENFEILKKLDLRNIQDFVELRERIEILETEIYEIKSFLVLD